MQNRQLKVIIIQTVLISLFWPRLRGLNGRLGCRK